MDFLRSFLPYDPLDMQPQLPTEITDSYKWKERCRRIKDSKNTKILYHVTDKYEATKILRSPKGKALKDGTQGLNGGGIYFETTIKAAKIKSRALSDLVVLKCEVFLGNVYHSWLPIPRNHSFRSLYEQDYDSVYVNYFSGDEYVVYNCDQVGKIEKVNWRHYSAELLFSYMMYGVAAGAILLVSAGATVAAGAGL